MRAAWPEDASEQRLGQVRFPLWTKLGLAFGLLMALALAGFGWWDFEQDLRQESAQRRGELLGLARSVAEAIDGDEHAGFQRGTDMDRASYQALYGWLCSVVEANGLMYASTLTADERGRLTYVIDATDAAPLPLGFPIFDVSEGHRRALAGELAFVADWQDEWGRYDSAFAPIRAGDGRVVGLLELDSDADARDWLLAQRLRRLLTGIGLGVLLAMVVAAAFARGINRHLGTLTRSALAMASGELDQRIDIPTRDEIGLLGRAFDSMVSGLRERELIKETFGRFVAPEVAARLLADPEGPQLGGEQRTVTILMSDLRGFTSMAEALGPKPMLALLNRYLTRMADVIMAHDGTINEFTGDGIVAFFGAPEAREDDVPRALACAVAMQRALHAFNAEEERALRMGIGVNTGPVIAGNIGSERRMKYSVVGDAINLAARLESSAVGGEVLVSEASLEAAEGLATVGLARTLRVKGKREPVRCFPLLGVGGRWSVALPEDDRAQVTVQLEAHCQRVEGKQVLEEELPLLVTAVGTSHLRIQGLWSLPQHQQLRLAIRIGEDRRIEDLYGRVVSIAACDEGWQAELSLTSVPAPAGRLLAALLATGRAERTEANAEG